MSTWWTYLEWQARLVKRYLTPGPAPAPITLFIDREELDRSFGADQEDPALSLTRAVVSKLDFGRPSQLFGQLLAEASGGPAFQLEPPPYLPLLALTVLAASEMGRDNEISPNAYYARLDDLLVAANTTVDTKYVQASFDVIQRMWEELAIWVSSQPALGVLTARNHKHFTKIGHSTSQALIRRSDRARLTSFFAAIDLRADAVPSEEQMLSALRFWCARDRGFSRPFVKALHDPEPDGQLLPVLMQTARTWDGNVVSASGRRWLPILLGLDLVEWRASWQIRWRQGLPEDLLEFTDGRVVLISEPDYSDLFDLTGSLPPVMDSVGTRFKATGETSVAMHKPKEVYVLVEDPRAAMWIEAQGLEPAEEHLLVVTPSRKAEVESFLRAAAAINPHERLPMSWLGVDNNLVPGWLIYRDCVFSKIALEKAIAAMGRSLISELRPDHPPVPRLVNGLKLPVPFGRSNTYITGGEPDLLLPVGAEARSVVACLDGECTRLLTSDFPIKLRANQLLEPGEHRLTVDGHVLVFHICESVPNFGMAPASREPAMTSWSAKVGSDSTVEPGLIARGRHTEVWAVDFRGHAERVEEPVAPRWLEECGLGPPLSYQPVLSSDVVFLVKVLRQQVLSIVPVSTHAPEFQHLDEDSAALWKLIGLTGPSVRCTSPIADYLAAWTTHGR
ncbi:hypothetical protein DFR70_105362 [Nocardia tenerifensis]|uniref:Uncharacterized protein n=1 Tax=Nocardia tenerifensis TaxID=228006 RepID=A0A318K191_9NOCA|nr:hypothetical protein [Nocardia tenerifensis]PXX64177.1 hypothetical protein DFR70_105362 [Nocardia tenerifensis]